MRGWLLYASALSLVLGCGPSDGGDGGGSGADADVAATALTIEPENPTVVTVNGTSAPVVFRATATFEDGSTAVLDQASWTLSETRLGTLAALTGKFQATGQLAGTGQVTVSAFGVTAMTSVTVRVEDEHIGEGVPPDAPDLFADPPVLGNPASPLLLYPLDGAVVPTTLEPPDVQWDVGTQGDIYRVTIDAGLASATAYLLHDGPAFRYDWLADLTSWTTIKQSAGASPVTFDIARWSAADDTVYGSITHTINVVNANVAGAIYYWDLSDGRIQRITSAGRESFMPSPPPRPADGKRCVACHTVSRDGRYMAAEMWDGGDFGAVFDLSIDLTADPAPTVVAPTQYQALFSTFNPDASRLLINAQTHLSLVDTGTGAPVPALGSGLPAAGAAHPTWSPDGTSVAYVANHDGSWAVDFTLGDIAVIPVSAVDTFGDPTVLRSAEGLANAWPSWSPDSEWIAFGRGTNSRGRNDAAGQVYPGSLHIVHRGGGGSTELSRANGGAGVMNSYLPNFSPFNEGGYFWLAFYSTRDYGNQYAGTRGTGRRQIWVAAVKTDITPGEDPSQVGFWLPNQDVATQNMSGYWAPEPPVD